MRSDLLSGFLAGPGTLPSPRLVHRMNPPNGQATRVPRSSVGDFPKYGRKRAIKGDIDHELASGHLRVSDDIAGRADSDHVDLSRRRRVRNREVSAVSDRRTIAGGGVGHGSDGIGGKLREVEVGSHADAKRIHAGYERPISVDEVVIGGVEWLAR